MLHSNAGELHQLFSTFNRVWGAGGDASLSLKTVDGKVSAVLEVQLGPPAALRPGVPEAPQQASGSWNQQPGQHCRRRRRGPGRQARDATRRKAWKKRRQEAQSSLTPPPPPPPPPQSPAVPPRRLVTVVRDRINRSSFSQLDGEAGDATLSPPATALVQMFKCEAFDPMNHACEEEFQSEDALDDHMEIHGEIVRCFACKRFFYDCDEATGCPGCPTPWPNWQSRPR